MTGALGTLAGWRSPWGPSRQGSAACLLTYFVVRGPFGTINDIGNATLAC